MDCKITSIKNRSLGFTLVEVLVASAVGSTVLLAAAALCIYTARSIASVANYADLDTKSRTTLDRMSMTIRQADKLLSYSTHSLVFSYNKTNQLVFTYDPTNRTLVQRIGTTETALLDECDQFKFEIFQRNTLAGTYDQYPTAAADTCKLVQMSWVCSRKILGNKQNTETVQTAKIVLRKQ